jgi:hypothetical protein
MEREIFALHLVFVSARIQQARLFTVIAKALQPMMDVHPPYTVKSSHPLYAEASNACDSSRMSSSVLDTTQQE